LLGRNGSAGGAVLRVEGALIMSGWYARCLLGRVWSDLGSRS